ncbi:hypothetical protein AXG93_4240s1020 [Marchantia polymorpha subsp. ruderalis]|uniref:Uncharacterized protein n=1 Tax=Marchantia polymorpha subsp. ruderalis TaxID=1480154 RepID=A0A176WEZ5_MARPO|nr:hypothetical protein AXG93_4240s1020 [Marchantia polymorpha subsp. ruderalis]
MQSRTRARPKTKASRGLVVTEVSDSSVKKTVAPIVDTPEVAIGELTQPVVIERPSAVVAQVGGTVVDAANVTLPSSFVEYDSVVPLLKYLDKKREKYGVSKEESGRCAKFEETCGGRRISNENGQKMTVDLLARLEKSREAYDAAVKRSERLITTAQRREKMHVKELVKVEARRAEEVRIAEELLGKIAEAKTTEEELRIKLVEIAIKCDKEFQRAEELSASLAKDVECTLKVESECKLLREQLGKADMRSQEWQRRMEKSEEAYRHLRDETTDEFRLRVERCLRRFAMWDLQTVKWLKLDSLERRLMSTKASGSAGQKQIVEIVKTFLEGFDEARQNVELEILNVLRRLGAEISLDDTVTATSDGIALETDSPQAVEIPELPL